MLLRAIMDVDTSQTLCPLPDARTAIRAAAAVLGSESVPVGDAVGRVLVAPVDAVADLPAWPNSALDGFALRAADALVALPVAFDVTAGDDPPALPEGSAAAIATGGVLPVGADAVVPIERSIVAGDGTVRADGAVAVGNGVRGVGADVAVGARIAAAGTRLTPLLASSIAAAGHGSVRCVRRPRVAVLVTGDELVAPGAPLARGQVHDSNSILITRTLEAFGCVVERVARVPDTLVETVALIGDALAVDLLVTSGGVSVGPRDHVKPALAELGVERIVWRVAIQPGKPVWVGSARSGTLVVGLPGNPLSTLVGLHLLVAPAVRSLLGLDEPPVVTMPLARDARRLPGRMRALPGRIVDGRVETIAEGSHQIARAASSSVLALIEAGTDPALAGTPVPVVPLDRW
jgi:molybdopterin molybdotransferase